MGLKVDYKEGQTPLSDGEMEGLLINTITTHGELDEFEQLNIEKAIEWTLTRKFKTEDILSEEFVRELHKRMFDDVWSWAGNFRLSEKNIGIKFHLIATTLKQLNDDCLFWINNKTFSEDEIAIRYKHRIVNIHCFANGNGRHSRLIADIIRKQVFNLDHFSWGGRANLVKAGEQRKKYFKVLREADKENIRPLINFAKS